MTKSIIYLFEYIHIYKNQRKWAFTCFVNMNKLVKGTSV